MRDAQPSLKYLEVQTDKDSSNHSYPIYYLSESEACLSSIVPREQIRSFTELHGMAKGRKISRVAS